MYVRYILLCKILCKTVRTVCAQNLAQKDVRLCKILCKNVKDRPKFDFFSIRSVSILYVDESSLIALNRDSPAPHNCYDVRRLFNFASTSGSMVGTRKNLKVTPEFRLYLLQHCIFFHRNNFLLLYFGYTRIPNYILEHRTFAQRHHEVLTSHYCR